MEDLSPSLQNLDINDAKEVLSSEPPKTNKKFPSPNNSRRQRNKGNDNRNVSKTTGEELDYIPTAVVIKNIPFSVKRELFLDIFTHLGLPIPFALNYHLDNGVFRGLAFANFRTPEETALVIHSIRGVEVCGRKLKIEYKKYNGSERKEQQPIETYSDAPPKNIETKEAASPKEDELDFNDFQTRVFFEQIASFYEDSSRAALIYPPNLDNIQRKLIHLIAERFNLFHYSEGVGEERHIRVSKTKPNASNIINKKAPPRRNNYTRGGDGNGQERMNELDGPYDRSAPKPFRNTVRLHDGLTAYPIRQPTLPDLKKNFALRKNETRPIPEQGSLST